MLEIIGEYAKDVGDTDVDQLALLAGRQKAEDMLARAASLDAMQHGGVLGVRVTNESGHKIPTGHIEGRRIWVNVRVFGDGDTLLREYGHYDAEEAHLDEASTTVYEMHVGLSEDAAEATGLPVGTTTHMALADTIVKDNRIPPRGFNNEAFNAGGAPVVGAEYADGQHWSDVRYLIPEGAERVEVRLYYATVTRHYIEALRDGNTTDHWGDTLYDLWLRTGKGAPILMNAFHLDLTTFVRGDLDGDSLVSAADLALLLAAWDSPAQEISADLNADGVVDTADLGMLISNFSEIGR